MKLDNDLIESLSVLQTKGCEINNTEAELEIISTSETNGYVFQFLQTLYLRLTGCRDNNYLVMIDSVNDFKDYGLDVNACFMRMKLGYQRLLAAGQISFYDCDTREKYTFIFSA